MTETNKKLHPLQKLVKEGNCMGCGFCAATYVPDNKLPQCNVEIKYDPQEDSFVPKVTNWQENTNPGSYLCPCGTVDMINLSKQVFNKLPEDYLLGIYQKLRVCYSTDEKNRSEAASGGIILEILKYLFETNQISMAYVLHPGKNPYGAEGIIINNLKQLKEIHGSVYHPTNFGASLKDLISQDGKFAFVGLPCQVEGLEMYKEKNPEFSKRHVLSIGLFCGGINKFSGVDYYLNGYNMSLKEIENIKYREGSWPGKIRVDLKNKELKEKVKYIPRIKDNSRFKILRYIASFQGYWMLKRCRLCPDQINDFADIAVGDPHLKKYKEKKSSGYSAVITRSERGEKIIDDLINKGIIKSEPISRDEMIKTQGYTLDNRRHSLAYLKMNSFFGGVNPEITYYPEVEKNVSFRHYVYAFVDLAKIYLPKNRITKKLYIPLQIFEYLFITFTPSIILSRVKKLLTNS